MSPRSAAVSWISQRTAMHEPYAYFEHDADMGIVGRGERIEEAFEQAATAMFAMMADPAQVRPQASVAIEFEEADVELALVTWLNLLLGEARSRGLVLGRFKLRRDGARWSGTAEGEPLARRTRARRGSQRRDAHRPRGDTAERDLGCALRRGRVKD